jgi:hypothetical protein
MMKDKSSDSEILSLRNNFQIMTPTIWCWHRVLRAIETLQCGTIIRLIRLARLGQLIWNGWKFKRRNFPNEENVEHN